MLFSQSITTQPTHCHCAMVSNRRLPVIHRILNVTLQQSQTQQSTTTTIGAEISAKCAKHNISSLTGVVPLLTYSMSSSLYARCSGIFWFGMSRSCCDDSTGGGE